MYISCPDRLEGNLWKWVLFTGGHFGDLAFIRIKLK